MTELKVNHDKIVDFLKTEILPNNDISEWCSLYFITDVGDKRYAMTITRIKSGNIQEILEELKGDKE